MVVGRAVRFAQSRVQWRFSGVRQGMIDVSALFDEELAELPVPMERSAMEIEVFSQRLE